MLTVVDLPLTIEEEDDEEDEEEEEEESVQELEHNQLSRNLSDADASASPVPPPSVRVRSSQSDPNLLNLVPGKINIDFEHTAPPLPAETIKHARSMDAMHSTNTALAAVIRKPVPSTQDLSPLVTTARKPPKLASSRGFLSSAISRAKAGIHSSGDGPRRTSKGKYFGVDLTELPKRKDNSMVPLFVEKCLEDIEKRGMSFTVILLVFGVVLVSVFSVVICYAETKKTLK